jgi:hypothetical protein
MRVMPAIARLVVLLLEQPANTELALSNARMAELIGTTDRNIRRCLAQLIEAGAVRTVVSRTYDKAAGHRRIVLDHEKLRAAITVTTQQ